MNFLCKRKRLSQKSLLTFKVLKRMLKKKKDLNHKNQYQFRNSKIMIIRVVIDKYMISLDKTSHCLSRSSPKQWNHLSLRVSVLLVIWNRQRNNQSRSNHYSQEKKMHKSRTKTKTYGNVRNVILKIYSILMITTALSVKVSLSILMF